MQSTQHGQRVGEVLEWSKGRVEVCRLQLNISEQTLNAKRNGHTLVTFFFNLLSNITERKIIAGDECILKNICG